MGETCVCPLCKKDVSIPLWDLGWVPKEQRVALRLMETEAVCYDCWAKHMEQLKPDVMLNVLTSLMDDYVCLVDESHQLKESTKETIERLEEENQGLREAMEDLQGKIADALR